MRSAFLLLALVAAASATIGWQSGRQFVYEYRTRAATAIPELKNQASGLGLRAKVIVQVKSPSELLVKMADLGLARIESETFSQNWRQELPLSYQPLEQEQAQGLQVPFKVLLRQGQVEAIEVDAEEPVWSVNIKRGLVSQMSLSLAKEMRQQSERHLSGNGIEKMIESEQSFEIQDEPAVSGKCRTRYTIVPLPEYVARQEEQDLPQEIKEMNQERPAYIITKSKDFSKCQQRPGFLHQGMVDETEQGVNGMDGIYKRYSSRTATTRYLIRGEPNHNFVVERVWSEDAFLVQPFASKVETIFISTNQTLVLREVKPIRNPMPEPSNLVRRSLIFQQQQGQSAEQQQQFEEQLEQPERYLRQSQYEGEQEIMTSEHSQYPKLTQGPPLSAYSGIYQHQVPVQKVKQQIKQLIREIEEDIKTLSELNKKKPSQKMDQVARALVSLNLEEMKELYRELIPQPHPQQPEKKVIKQIFCDALAMAGTNPAIVLLKEKIQKREIKGEQASQLLMTFPQTVKTPTPEILRELVQMTKSLKEQESVWTTAMLAVSNLIHRACVNQHAQRAAFGYKAYKYCGRQEIEIILPYLKEQLYQTQNPSKQQALVQAIANIGSPEILQVLRPVIRGEVSQDKQVRAQAIWSLSRLARLAHSEQVLRPLRNLLAPIYASPMEPTVTRIAAFMTVLTAKPSEAFFTEAATNTWFEQSQQVGQFVYKTLASLANSTYPSHRNVSRMAQLALPLAKPFRLGAQYSQNILMTNAMPEREMVSYLNMAMISGKYSLIPEAFYYKTKMHMGGFDMPIAEMALHTQGFQRMINEFIAPTQQEGISSGLDIHTRKDQPLRASLWAKFAGQFERLITMDTLRQWAKEGIVEMEGKNVFRVNYQKALNLDNYELSIPAENGLPVYAVRKNPVLISLQGKIEVETQQKSEQKFNMYPKELVVKTDLKPFICTTRVIESGVACPLTKEVFVSGHKTHGLFQLPGKMEAKINVPKKEFEIVFERAHELPTKVELIKYEAYPFTGQAKFFNFVEKNLRIVKVQPQFAKKHYHFGQKTLGLALEAVQQMDEPSIDAAGMYHAVKPHTLQSLIQFYAIPQSLKAINYELNMNLPASETKEAKLKVYYGNKQRQWNSQNFESEQELEKHYQNPWSPQQYGKFAEEAQRYFNNPMESMPECQEEQSPCRNILEHLVRSPSARRQQQQELEIESQSQTNVHSIHAELQMNGPEPRRFRASFVVNQTPSGQQQKMSALLEQVRGNQEIFSVRAHGQMSYPELPLRREELLQAQKTALGHFMVQIRCQEHKNTLKARVVLAQTEEQKRFAEQSPIARECQQHENRDLPYSPACMQARYQATLLNKVVFDLEAEHEMPKTMRNMTYQLDDLVKYAFYPHMSQQRVDIRNPEKKVKIVLDFKPIRAEKFWTVLDAKVYKPRENTFFSMLKLSPVMESVFPISARYQTYEKALNHIMGQQYTPMCKIQKKMIQTFDNVSIPYELNECYHLIAKDCSKQVPVQVFAKRTGEGKQIKMTVGSMEVEITPQRQVRVNGRPVEVSQHQQEKIKDEQTQETVLVVKRPGVHHEIEVVAPIHGLKVRTDGQNFFVGMSNIFRGRTCGLCGDMNGEKTAELKDPKGCVRSNPETFGRSYALGSCQAPAAQQCERVESRPVHYEQRSPFQGEQSQSNGLRYITKVENRGNEMCFSVKPVPKCALGHQPTNTVNMEMGFHCVHRGRAATELAARASQGILEEMLEKRADFNEWISVPETCQQIEAY